MRYRDFANDPDAPQDIDLDWADDDEDDDLIDCPACGRSFHADAIRCPYCGWFVTEESAAEQRARGWFWPVMVGLLVALILVMWHGLRF
jgi:ribosomal protein L37E